MTLENLEAGDEAIYDMPPRLSERESIEPPYEADKLANIIVQSFRYSQGSSTLQRIMLKRIAMRNGGRVTEEATLEALPLAAEAIDDIRNNPGTHKPPDYQRNTTARAEAFTQAQKYLNMFHDFSKGRSTDAPDGYSSNDNLAQHIVSRDIKFIVGSEDSVPKGRAGKPISQYVLYGLTSRKTSATEFDEVFEDASSPETIKWLFKRNGDDFKSQFADMLAAHFEQRPLDRDNIDPAKMFAISEELGEELSIKVGLAKSH